MKDWYLPLLNQPSRTKFLGLEYFRFEAEQALKNHLHFESMKRVAALRKSCGVEPEKTSTINVRLPPRYAGSSK